MTTGHSLCRWSGIRAWPTVRHKRHRCVVATVMAGYDGHRGWINNLVVGREERRRGCERTMMRQAEDRLRIAGCPKVNLQIRRTNADTITFFASLGYVQDEVVSNFRRDIFCFGMDLLPPRCQA